MCTHLKDAEKQFTGLPKKKKKCSEKKEEGTSLPLYIPGIKSLTFNNYMSWHLIGGNEGGKGFKGKHRPKSPVDITSELLLWGGGQWGSQWLSLDTVNLMNEKQ